MKQPNILFFFPDQHRRDWFPYENETFFSWKMEKPDLNLPNIEKIMAKGVTFTNAITPSALCSPARACLASGTRYHNCGTPNNGDDYPLELPTIYQTMRNQGYEVLGCGKFDLRKYSCDWFEAKNYDTLGFTDCIDNEGKLDGVSHYKKYGEPRGPYLKMLEEKGFAQAHIDDFEDRKKQTYQTPLPDEVYCDNWVGQNGLDLLKKAEKTGKPWFLQVNFTGPHDPFDVTQKMYDSVKHKHFALGHGGEQLENAEDIRRCYAAMIENIDRNIGLYLDYLEKTNQLDNTILVYASDHGEMLGDHGKYSKGSALRGSVSIPFVISHPNAPRKGEFDDSLVELQDLTATFAQFVGKEWHTGIDSLSLVDLLQGKVKKHRDYIYSSLVQPTKKTYRCVIAENHKLIANENGLEALYNLETDPWEDENILNSQGDMTKKLALILGNL